MTRKSLDLLGDWCKARIHNHCSQMFVLRADQQSLSLGINVEYHYFSALTIFTFSTFSFLRETTSVSACFGDRNHIQNFVLLSSWHLSWHCRGIFKVTWLSDTQNTKVNIGDIKKLQFFSSLCKFSFAVWHEDWRGNLTYSCSMLIVGVQTKDPGTFSDAIPYMLEFQCNNSLCHSC